MSTLASTPTARSPERRLGLPRESSNGQRVRLGSAAGSRLEHIGLVSNTGIHPGKGAPNSWALTEKGRRVADGIRAHTERPA